MFSKISRNAWIAALLAMSMAFMMGTSAPLSAQENTAPAGQLLFVHGTVQLTRNEETNPAERGTDLLNQDVITTQRASSAQIRFSDNSLVAVRPESTFLIEEYEYDENNPDASVQRTQLVRGGLRAVTGAIGRAKPENVEFKTPVATMGIRGTVLSIVHVPLGQGGDFNDLPEGTFVQVEQGSVEVSNNGGSQLIGAGETFYVPDENTAPVPAPVEAEAFFESQQAQENEDDPSPPQNLGGGTNPPGNTPPGTNQPGSSDPVTPPENTNTEQGEDDIEENLPEPDDLPTWGLDFSPFGIFGIIADNTINPTGEFLIGDYTIPALRFVGGDEFEQGYIDTADFFSTSSSDINWARWAVGDYTLTNSIGDPVNTGFDFMYLLTSNPVFDEDSLSFIMDTWHVSAPLVFTFGGGPGVTMENGASFVIGQNSSITLNPSTQDIAIAIDFGYNQASANRTMVGEVSFQELFESFIALTETGANPIIQDGRLWAVLSGSEDWGLDAFLASLYVLLEDPETQQNVEGYGMLAFVNDCIVNFPCPVLGATLPLSNDIPDGLTFGGNGNITIRSSTDQTFLSLFEENIFFSAQENEEGTLRFFGTDGAGVSSNFLNESVGTEIETENGSLFVLWGHWDAESYEAYTLDTETNEATWFDNTSSYHYIFISEEYTGNLPTTGSKRFEVAGGSGLISDTDGRVLPFLDGTINIDFDEAAMGVVLVFDDEGIEAVLTGSNLDLLSFLNGENGVTLVGDGFDSGSMQGDFAGAGMDALIALIEAIQGEEIFRGTGVFAQTAEPEPLPEFGVGFSPYGVFGLLTDAAEQPAGELNLLSFGNDVLTFTGNNNANRGYLNTSSTFLTSNSDINWASWSETDYELLNSLGEPVETGLDFMYLLTSNPITDATLFADLVTNYHFQSGITFTLGSGPGVSLSNGALFSVGNTSFVSVNPFEDSVLISIDFTYGEETELRNMSGSSSFMELFANFIALEEMSANPIIQEGSRLYAVVSGSEDWGIDAFLAALQLIIEDPETQEIVEGYGMLAFLNDCLVNFPCPYVGAQVSGFEAPNFRALGQNNEVQLRSDGMGSWFTYLQESGLLTAQESGDGSLRFIATDASAMEQGTTFDAIEFDTENGQVAVMWGYWMADAYQLYLAAESEGEEPTWLDTASNYHFVLFTNAYEGDLPTQGEKRFDQISGSGLVSETDGRVLPFVEGNVTINFADGSMGVMLVFDDDGNQAMLTGSNLDLLAFLSENGSISLEGDGFDAGSMFGELGGSGIDALIALITAIQDDETFRGSGVFAYTPPLEVPTAGIGLSTMGYLERVRDLSAFQAEQGPNGIFPVMIQSSSLIFEALGLLPEQHNTYALTQWNPDSTTVIEWGAWAPGTYTLKDALGYTLANDHVFPYLMADNRIESFEDYTSVVSAQHAQEGEAVFQLGGGTGIEFGNGESVSLSSGSEIMVDFGSGTVYLDFIFQYSGDEDLINRELFGSGTVEDLYNSYIEMEEGSAVDSIVDLARLYGSMTGTEASGIDAMLTGLYMAIQDLNGQTGNGFGLHYFLYCWMGESCEQPNPEPEIPPQPEVYGGLMAYGYVPRVDLNPGISFTGSSGQGDVLWAPYYIEGTDYAFWRTIDTNNAFIYPAYALMPDARADQAIYWGWYNAGNWNFYDLADDDFTDPLEGSGERQFAYAHVYNSGFNLEDYGPASLALDSYTSPMSFRFAGATPIAFANGDNFAVKPTSTLEIDPTSETITVQLDLTYSAEGFSIVHELLGSGSVQDLYEHYIELFEQGDTPIVEFARLFGALSGKNGEYSSDGNYNVDGLLAGLLVGLVGDETNFGFGTLAFAHCYYNNDCSFSNLPTIAGKNLTNAGILDENLAELEAFGNADITEISAGTFAPTYVNTNAYTFQVDQGALPLFSENINMQVSNPNSLNTVYWGVWEGGSYSLENFWGDTMDNTRNMPYLISDYTIGSPGSALDIANANHSGQLEFTLYTNTGMELSNGLDFLLDYDSTIVLDLDAENESQQLLIDIGYQYYEGAYTGYMGGTGSVFDLYNSYIELADDGNGLNFKDIRFYGTLTGDDAWGLDGLLAGLYVDFMDGQQVTGFGLYPFILCGGNPDFPCGLTGGEPITGDTVADLYPGRNHRLYGANNALSQVTDDGTTGLLFNIIPGEDYPLLALFGEGMNGMGALFSTQSQNPADDWTGAGHSIVTGTDNEDVLWGYWAPESYTLEEVDSENGNVPYDNTSPYFYMIVSNATNTDALADLQINVGSASYSWVSGTGGLINTANGSQIALTEGAIDVDFYFGTFDVNLTYEGQGNTLSALQQDFLTLFNNNQITLEGTGIFDSGALTGTFVGQEAEGIAAMIDAWLIENGELVRGIEIFERMP